MRQTSAIFFCLLVLGAHATTFLNTQQNKQGIISDIQNKNSQFYELLEEGSQFVVDEVLNLLKNLEDAARNDLSTLIAAWAVRKPILEEALKKATEAHANQVKVCDALEAQQHALEAAILERAEEIVRNIAQQKTNNATAKRLQTQRCDSNAIYIDHVIAHRDALDLFKVLLAAIDGYKAGSLIQISNINQASQTLGDYINIYAKEHSATFNGVMVQLQNSINMRKDSTLINTKLAVEGDRVADKKVENFAANDEYKQVGRVVQREQNGTKHIDNKEGEIKLESLDQDTVRSLANVKGQLTKIINTLISEEETSSKEDIANEAEANSAYITIKSNLQDESRKLARRNEQLARQIAELQERLARKIAQVKECRIQEAKLLAIRVGCQALLDEETARFELRQSELQSQVALFQRLYVYYKERVYAVATQADKERVQDYTDNKNFDKSRISRNEEKFNALDKKVDQFAVTESNKNVGAFAGF